MHRKKNELTSEIFLLSFAKCTITFAVALKSHKKDFHLFSYLYIFY
jgi:hypothetical protein